jgi:hypothetical protein
MPKNICHQKTNPSRETVPLNKQINLMCDLRGCPAPVQCPAAVVPLLLIPASSSEVVDKKVHCHPAHLTLQHRGKKFNQRVGHSTDSTVQHLFVRLNPGQTAKLKKKLFQHNTEHKRLNRHPTHLTLQHTGKKFNQREGPERRHESTRVTGHAFLA